MAQVPIALLNGYDVVAAFSLTSGDITIQFDNGLALTVTPTAYGAEGAFGPVGYRSVFDVSGLFSEFARYPYTVTQGANSRRGTYTTRPSKGQNWRKMFQSCDGASGYASLGRGTGFWQYVREFYDDPIITAGILFCDDFCYASSRAFASAEDGVDVPIGPSSVDGVPTYRNYCIIYTAHLGLYAHVSTPATHGHVSQFGHDEYRQFGYANFNIWPQWGDWEFKNDLGMGVAGVSGANGLASQDNVSAYPGGATNRDYYDAGRAAYMVFLGVLQPPGIDGVNSNAWGFECGNTYICAPDYITHADLQASGVLYGATQIASIKTALNNDSPIKCLGLGHGIRHLVDPAGSVVGSGSQYPMFNSALAEYQALMTTTGLTPPSLMDNPKCNGLKGVLFTEHGDYHRMKVEHHQKAAYTGNAVENFWSFTVGGNNGGAAGFSVTQVVFDDYHAGTAMPSAGADTGLTRLHYLGSPDQLGGARQAAGQVMTFYEDRTAIEVHVDMRAAPTAAEIVINNNQTVWSGKFIHRYGGNTAHDADVEIAPMAMMAADAGFV